MSSEWTPEELSAMDGDVVLVTGANSGIGFEGTKLFADAGATVIMACRTAAKARDAAEQIREAVPEADLDPRACDLASLDAIAEFATGVRADYDRLDVLCNNAGVMAIPRSETADGFEEQFGVNHLGHFALTGHLLSTLAATPGGARVVTQSSGLHERGSIDEADLMNEREYDKWDAYAQSKLANLLFAFELDRRAAAADLPIESLGCHPGYADTGLQRRGPDREGSRLKGAMMRVANTLFGQSPARGAEPMVYAAVGEDVSGGDYVGPGGLFGMRGHPERQSPSDAARDDEVAERLWDASEELTGVDYGFDAA